MTMVPEKGKVSGRKVPCAAQELEKLVLTRPDFKGRLRLPKETLERVSARPRVVGVQGAAPQSKPLRH